MGSPPSLNNISGLLHSTRSWCLNNASRVGIIPHFVAPRPARSRTYARPSVRCDPRRPRPLSSRPSANMGFFTKSKKRTLSIGGTPPTTLAEHHQEVDKIAAAVKGFYDRGEGFRIRHGSTNSTRSTAMGKDPNKVVDTSRLNHVMLVDTETQTALVEPNVPMDRLVEETLKYGLIPPVVMEFPGITVGGGYSGTSGESSSFKHGFFDRTLKQVEMVLANGEVITASEQENADLFRGAAGAMGTLGVTTMVEIQLHKAAKFVETTYHPVTSMQDAISKLQNFASRTDEFDYIDGIMYSPTSGAIITGRMTDTPTAGPNVQRFSAAKDPWFYLHVQSRIAQSPTTPTSEAIPLPEYLFRYDRGGFWVGVSPFKYFSAFGIPFNDWTRWFLDDFLHTRMMYKAMHASGGTEQMIVQDLALPYENAAEFVKRMDDLTGIWPLWLCPLKQSPELNTMHPHYKEFEKDGKTLKPMLNIGLWGMAPPGAEAYLSMNRSIEKTLQELRGMKWLYAQAYFPEEDFWKDFDKASYDALRKKYNATTLPTVYDKVFVDIDKEWERRKNVSTGRSIVNMWPFSGFFALKKAIDSKAYLNHREATWKEWVPRGNK